MAALCRARLNMGRHCTFPAGSARSQAALPGPIAQTPAMSPTPQTTSLRAGDKPLGAAPSGFRRDVGALGGSQPLTSPHVGFQARHVCSELSKLRESNPSRPHGVWPAPHPQGTCASWQDTHILLLCPSPGPVCPFPGHQPCEIPRMTILLLRDLG